MNWTELLTSELNEVSGIVQKLITRVDDSELSWKPEEGENWMSLGQLLYHLGEASGMCFKCFMTGDWGFEEMAGMPPVESLPSVSSTTEALERVKADYELAMSCIKEAGEERLDQDLVAAPWDPRKVPLGKQLLSMVQHLESHKSQLYYYLKLQGKSVNTFTLYGMD